MASPLDPQELEALMQAIQEGRVGSETEAGAEQGDASIVPYDLTSQDRIIRGQMPTLDSINERIASSFGKSLAGRLRLELRVACAPAVLMKFAEVTGTVADPDPSPVSSALAQATDSLSSSSKAFSPAGCSAPRSAIAAWPTRRKMARFGPT